MENKMIPIKNRTELETLHDALIIYEKSLWDLRSNATTENEEEYFDIHMMNLEYLKNRLTDLEEAYDDEA